MTDTPKPPMVVWLHEDVSSHMTGIDRWTTARTEHADQIHHQGPYIHLDQFLAEVQSVADGKHAVTTRQYSSDFMEAVEELTKEIKEGKT